MYDDFAAVYDSLMDDFDYPAWARYYLSIIKAAGCTPRTMCECGCGTGSLSVYFARAGLRLTASDLSEEMLRLAQIKARKAGVSIPFVCQDMRALELPRPVDAIAACCDAVNYLTDRDSVRAFFDGAFRFLKGLAAHIAHAGKVHHQPFGVCADMRIVFPADDKFFLPFKHPGRIAGQRLRQPEKEVQSRHEIQREQPELDANPEHQRYAEHAAQHHARVFPPKEQNRRRQIGQAVDDQQGNAGKHKILKQ